MTLVYSFSSFLVSNWGFRRGSFSSSAAQHVAQTLVAPLQACEHIFFSFDHANWVREMSEYIWTIHNEFRLDFFFFFYSCIHPYYTSDNRNYEQSLTKGGTKTNWS
jgi:hypothetical protein